MKQIILKIDGMMCGMCEVHVNDAVRNACKVQQVTSSHKKGETVIITESENEIEVIKKAIEATGYRVLSVECNPCNNAKKGFFSLFKK